MIVLALRVTIERFTHDWFPGFVECSFVDATGRTHLFEEKVPVVSNEALDASSAYPRDGAIACHLLTSRSVADGREVVTIDTNKPWDIESKEGESQFEVFRDQLLQFESC